MQSAEAAAPRLARPMTGKEDDAAGPDAGGGGSADAAAERTVRLEKDMATVEEGLRLMLTNRLHDADMLFAEAGNEAARRTIDVASGERDPRGACIMSLSVPT